MGNDVVERAGALRKLSEIERLERDVGNAYALREGPGGLDRFTGEIDAYECTALQSVRHRHEIAAVAAPHLEEPTAIRRRRSHATKRGHCRKMVRMGVRVSESGIANRVVGRQEVASARAWADRLYLMPRPERQSSTVTPLVG